MMVVVVVHMEVIQIEKEEKNEKQQQQQMSLFFYRNDCEIEYDFINNLSDFKFRENPNKINSSFGGKKERKK